MRVIIRLRRLFNIQRSQSNNIKYCTPSDNNDDDETSSGPLSAISFMRTGMHWRLINGNTVSPKTAQETFCSPLINCIFCNANPVRQQPPRHMTLIAAPFNTIWHHGLLSNLWPPLHVVTGLNGNYAVHFLFSVTQFDQIVIKFQLCLSVDALKTMWACWQFRHHLHSSITTCNAYPHITHGQVTHSVTMSNCFLQTVTPIRCIHQHSLTHSLIGWKTRSRRSTLRFACTRK